MDVFENIKLYKRFSAGPVRERFSLRIAEVRKPKHLERIVDEEFGDETRSVQKQYWEVFLNDI